MFQKIAEKNMSILFEAKSVHFWDRPAGLYKTNVWQMFLKLSMNKMYFE